MGDVKRYDPAKVFVCASCKRHRPKSQREKGRNRCRDRADCGRATVEWLCEQRFAVGATRLL